jgi:hypothetical protein
MSQQRAFEGVQDEPCPVCLELAERGIIQPRAVMPLPEFPAMLRQDGRKCCRDCQATETTMAVIEGQHPQFEPARLTVANERVEGLVMPEGMMERFGMCAMGYVAPASIEDLPDHHDWLARHGIPDASYPMSKQFWKTAESTRKKC